MGRRKRDDVSLARRITTEKGLPEIERRIALVILAALCLQFVLLTTPQAWKDAATADEPIYMLSGITALTKHQLRFNVETPPLPKVLAALPALAARPVIPTGKAFQDGNSFAYGPEFFEAQRGADHLRRLLFLSRLMPIVEGVLTGLALYALAAGLFGRAAGLLASGAWLTTPFVVGLSHLNGVDVPTALCVVLASLATTRYLRSPTAWRAAIIGLACGTTILTRTTGLLLSPVLAAVVVGVHWRRPRLAVSHAALLLLVAWLSVWIGVRAISPFPDFERLDPFVFPERGPSESTASELVRLVPWPEEYDTGIFDLDRISTGRTPAFLLGRAWDGGRWWFWPGSMLVKLPAPVLLMILAGFACWLKLAASVRRRAALAVLVPALALGLFVLLQQTERQLGLRYMLPAIALGLVAGSPLVILLRSRWVGPFLIGALGVAQLAGLWGSYPHSLAWTSPPFRPGYQMAADSNLDWGQDLYRLQRWGRNKEPWVAYFPFPISSDFPLPGQRLDGSTDLRQVKGWVAVSATMLTAFGRDELSWLRAYCPVGHLGGTILLYRFSGPPDPAPGPVTPASPCPGEFSERS